MLLVSHSYCMIFATVVKRDLEGVWLLFRYLSSMSFSGKRIVLEFLSPFRKCESQTKCTADLLQVWSVPLIMCSLKQSTVPSILYKIYLHE